MHSAALLILHVDIFGQISLELFPIVKLQVCDLLQRLSLIVLIDRHCGRFGLLIRVELIDRGVLRLLPFRALITAQNVVVVLLFEPVFAYFFVHDIGIKNILNLENHGLSRMSGGS